MYIQVQHNGKSIGYFDYCRETAPETAIELAKAMYPFKGILLKEIFIPKDSTLNLIYRKYTFLEKFKKLIGIK